MAQTFGFDTYLSSLTWRYGTDEMRRLWSEAHKRLLWRRVWVALAEAQAEVGIVTDAQATDLKAHESEVDLQRAAEIEAVIRHDLMSEVQTFAEQCSVGGGIIHLGATSMDIEDNAEVLRMGMALDLLLERLGRLVLAFADRIESLAEAPTMAFTHLQPAEPTTMGYRLAQYAQDLCEDWRALRRLRADLRGKGLKGAVGTSASYGALLAGTGWTTRQLETRVMEKLGLRCYPVSTQTYPRKQDYTLLSALAGLGQSVYKFAFDLRLLQSPPLGEWSEPFGRAQVGSSAMPFKRNPIVAENVDSLARWLAALPRVAWDNAAHSLLERTLDDSANRRSIIAESFLLADVLLRRGLALIEGLQIDSVASERLLRSYGVFAASERLLMEAAKRGADRQELHEVIRVHALTAWGAVREGRENPLADLLAADPTVSRHLNAGEVRELLDVSGYVGDAPERARDLARAVRAELSG
jgi:adenylosuccinate lyase